MIKKYGFILIGCLIAGAAGYLFYPTTKPNQALPLHDTPRDLPEIIFEDIDGNSHNLKQYRGKVILLNFWATWCAPCKEEMPALNRLDRLLKQNNVIVIALSLDQDKKAAQQFLEERELRRVILGFDTEMKSLTSLKLENLPTTLIIGTSGQELARIPGIIDWSSPEIINGLKQL